MVDARVLTCDVQPGYLLRHSLTLAKTSYVTGLLLAVSNHGGGIAKHLSLTAQVIDGAMLELPETTGLSTKIRRVRHALRVDAASTIVTHGVAAGLSARLRGRRLRGVRHVEFWHGDPFLGSAARQHAFRVLAAGGLAPAVQVFTHEWLVDVYGDPRSQSVVLPNAVPLQPVAHPGPRRTSATGDRSAVFLGRFSAEKGLADLVGAWPSDALTAGWRLKLFGDDGLGLRLPEGVDACGYTSDPLGVLKGADLAVIPSRSETGPYVALEAASVAVPLVGTRVGDMTGMVEQSGCGWLADPGDPTSLETALRTALRTRETDLRQTGARGAAWLQENRPFDEWCRRLEELYAA
jgi:glycosyltransferase involved in cell wall biosynthesis